jgi:hypothetical protein
MREWFNDIFWDPFLGADLVSARDFKYQIAETRRWVPPTVDIYRWLQFNSKLPTGFSSDLARGLSPTGHADDRFRGNCHDPLSLQE